MAVRIPGRAQMPARGAGVIAAPETVDRSGGALWDALARLRAARTGPMRMAAAARAAGDHDLHRQHVFPSHRRAMPMVGVDGVLLLRD